MAALDLNSIRATIESRLVDELTKAPPLPVVFITNLLVLKITKVLYNV